MSHSSFTQYWLGEQGADSRRRIILQLQRRRGKGIQGYRMVCSPPPLLGRLEIRADVSGTTPPQWKAPRRSPDESLSTLGSTLNWKSGNLLGRNWRTSHSSSGICHRSAFARLSFEGLGVWHEWIRSTCKAELCLGIDILEGDVATCPWMCKVQPAKRHFELSGGKWYHPGPVYRKQAMNKQSSRSWFSDHYFWSSIQYCIALRMHPPVASLGNQGLGLM